MKRIFLFFVPLVALVALSCDNSTNLRLLSPSRDIAVSFSLDSLGSMFYSVRRGGVEVIAPSKLGFTTVEGVNLESNFSVTDHRLSSHNERWEQPWGENKINQDHHRELVVKLSNEDVNLKLIFRAFDDGVALRYHYKALEAESLQISDELTEFNIAQDATTWSIPANFETYELLYRKLPLDSLSDANTPMTFKLESGIYGSIHEAALTDFPEMTLRATAARRFKADLAPWPNGIKAEVAGEFVTPWRTLQLGQQAVDLINSSLILNLNEPSKIADASWIRPMKYIGVWWGMHLGIETWEMDERHGATTQNAIKYIDFAAANNIEGVLFEGWNQGWENWGKSQYFDYTAPYADFDIEQITAYAASKGIEILGHHETGGYIENYEAQMCDAFDWYKDLGVNSVKTGYAGGFPGGYFHHSQYGVRHYRKVVEAAAERQITINAHEPIKPTGIRRTYPNMMTREGARGMEWNAWSEGNPTEHYLLLPFTRLLAGPMDYTPGTFDILLENSKSSPQRKKWNGNDQGNSRVNSTLAKQIANWVILYSPLQMASDLVEHYQDHPAFKFFVDFDADCDWSKALMGEVGEYLVVVRRAGDRYFLGASTGVEPRELQLSLDFLKPGVRYRAEIYADGDDAHWQHNPTSYALSEMEVDASITQTIKMAAGGGQAILFTPVQTK